MDDDREGEDEIRKHREGERVEKGDTHKPVIRRILNLQRDEEESGQEKKEDRNEEAEKRKRVKRNKERKKK